jgi:hypothetical protein
MTFNLLRDNVIVDFFFFDSNILDCLTHFFREGIHVHVMRVITAVSHIEYESVGRC